MKNPTVATTRVHFPRINAMPVATSPKKMSRAKTGADRFNIPAADRYAGSRPVLQRLSHEQRRVDQPRSFIETFEQKEHAQQNAQCERPVSELLFEPILFADANSGKT